MYIDTHAHIYLDKFANDRAELIERAIENRVEKILLPNIDTETIAPMHSLCEKYANVCLPMMGLHPCSVTDKYKEQLEEIEAHLDPERHIAIGEIGIDLHWDDTYIEEQKRAFRRQVKWGHGHNLPIVIHSRKSIPLILDILEEMELEGLRGVFHCFTGTKNDVSRISKLGFYFGIGGIITFVNADLDETLRGVPREKILLETDAPYLSPEPMRGKRNEPAFLVHTASKLADTLGIQREELMRLSTGNARSLFDI